jgi:hypothetical protein
MEKGKLGPGMERARVCVRDCLLSPLLRPFWATAVGSWDDMI